MNTFLLLNKDRQVALFSVDTEASDTDTVFRMVEQYDRLPYGFRTLHEWLCSRKASRYNGHMREIMRRFRCEANIAYIEATHAASICDTFWVRKATDSITWKDVSLFQNPFTQSVSELAYRGKGDYTPESSYHSPEMTCEGSFPRCYRRLKQQGQFGSDIYFYKRTAGYGKKIEPYCEMLSSMIAAAVSPGNTVSYQLVHQYGRHASRCNLFTSEKYGYASMGWLRPDSNMNMLSDMLRFFAELGPEYERRFREMIVIDALCLNRDRHLGNFGLLVDNDTLEPVRYAPFFDFNLALSYNVSESDLPYIGEYLFRKRPQIGTDYIRAGQAVMDDRLRERTEPLVHFSFAFEGDERFSANRVKLTEMIVRQTAEALLSEKKLTSVMAFKAPEREKDKTRAMEEVQRKNGNLLKEGFRQETESIVFQKGCFSHSDHGLICLETVSYLLAIDFIKGTIRLQQQENGIKAITLTLLKGLDPAFATECELLLNSLKDYCTEKQVSIFDAALQEHL